MRNYGDALGIAYQIYDDCLDLAGSEAEAGKTLGTDIRKGKFTLPILLILQHAKELDHNPLNNLLLGEDSVNEEELSRLIESTGTLKVAAETALRMIGEGTRALDTVPENRYVQGMKGVSSHLESLLGRFL
jgi:octaprenyl-diphosphate synthase